MSKKTSSKRLNKRSQQPHKLPQQDLLTQPQTTEENQFTADLLDLLKKIRNIRSARGGSSFHIPPAIMTEKYTKLPNDLYEHLLRLILWTTAISTPGTIPKWAANHPAIRASELATHNLTYTTKDGNLLLTCYIGITEIDCKHINDPEPAQAYSPTVYDYIGTPAAS